jgi:hypothetical protein
MEQIAALPLPIERCSKAQRGPRIPDHEPFLRPLPRLIIQGFPQHLGQDKIASSGRRRPTRPAGPEDRVLRSMSPKSKTVLVVDDDEGMRDTLTAILKRS